MLVIVCWMKRVGVQEVKVGRCIMGAVLEESKDLLRSRLMGDKCLEQGWGDMVQALLWLDRSPQPYYLPSEVLSIARN